MRKIKEILRLKFEAGQGQRQIARSCGVGKTSVAECLARFSRSGLSWPQAGQLDEAVLEQLRSLGYVARSSDPLGDSSAESTELCPGRCFPGGGP